MGALIGAAATGALAFGLVSTGVIPTAVTAQAADAQSVVGDRSLAASRGEFRDASAIQELNDPFADEDLRSPQATAALAQDQARVQELQAAAAREAQAATARQAATAPAAPATPSPTADDGTAGAAAYRAYARARVGARQFGCLDPLWQRESHWQPSAKNPGSTAYGIPQLLTATWGATGIAKTSNGFRQVDAGLVYIAAAYGTPCAAWSHSRATGWY
jgi:hypothetical protein